MSRTNYFAIINLKLGDIDLTATDDHMISMSNLRMSDNLSQTLVVDIYDHSALILEAELVKGNVNIEISYGYSWKMSKVYSGRVIKYMLQFSGRGVMLTLEAMPEGVIEATENQIKEYPGMRIDEIVTKIARDEGWEIGEITKCEEVPLNSELGTSGGMMEFHQENESINQFIESRLIPYARSASTGEGGFIYRLEPLSNGNSRIFFTPMSDNDVPKLELEYIMGTESERIISFEPQFNESLVALLGGGSVSSTTQDPLTNEVVNVNINGKTSSNKDIKRVVGGTSYSFAEMSSLSKNLWQKAINLSYPATLNLVGEPNIEPLSIISMVVMTEDGFIHHSSGAYLVETVEDEIDDGVFTTTLNLIRNPHKAPVASGGSGGGYIDSSGSTNLPSDLPPSAYLEASKEWIGTPYLYGGTTKSGIDCSSFTQQVFAKLGINLPRVASQQGTRGRSVSYTTDYRNMQAGDLIFWNAAGSSTITHVGIYLGRGQMIHAGSSKGVEVRSVFSTSSLRLHSVRRI